MSAADETWNWIRPPLDQMKRRFAANPEQPWETQRTSFLHELGLQKPDQHPVTERLFQWLDHLSAEERNRALGSDKIDNRVEELIRQTAAEQDAQQQSPPESQEDAAVQAGYDEHAWQAYLTQNGPRWDGTDAAWNQFQEWFKYHAGECGLSAPATALLDYLTTQPVGSRITTLATYGVTITPPQAAVQAGYDEHAWQAYLTQNGPRWDGTDAAWNQFQEWFKYHAGERGLSAPATALLDYLTTQPVDSRITTLATYGVTITPPQPRGAQEPTEPGEQPATTPGDPELAEENEITEADIDSLMKESLGENREFAKIPEARRQELITEALSELETESS
jgi:hypothetical protein